MKKRLIFLILFVFIVSFLFAGKVWVNGYYRTNGTYVSGYYRNTPSITIKSSTTKSSTLSGSYFESSFLTTTPKKITTISNSTYSTNLSKTDYTTVNSYIKKNGTIVQSYNRSTADNNFYNNWSTKGNTNPFTGKTGTKTKPKSIWDY